MRKIYLIFLCLVLCTNTFGATGRSANSIVRSTSKNTTVRQTSENSNSNVVNRSVDSRKNAIERTAIKTVSARSSVPKKTTIARIASSKKRISRAATTTPTNSFGNAYNTCRDAYFTCMDQFCANKDDTYRRCICSPKMQEITNKQNLLSQTATSLQDFYDYNIDAIPKTAEEITAMQNASDGESAIKTDKSNSALTLNSIKEVLYNTKQNALTTNDKFDTVSNVQTIWDTTDLIHGSDIMELSGEQLYNSVHSQCSSLVKTQCESSSDLKMVASAYGMYIENDCTLLESAIHSKIVEANTDIRSTRHKMQDTRLENYNAHNSLSLNDCVKQVREDITKDSAAACGPDYIHCLDTTGLYLNKTTGEPIYSTNFYQLENQLSLSGDILKNKQNSALVKTLNSKKILANNTLDSCRDVSDEVWNEFLRQAVVEIYQNQHSRIKQVKNECLNVVNKCYLSKRKDLTDYADDVSDMLLSYAFETSEQMCKTELNTCANLYGGGPEGLSLLISTMTELTDLNIAQECPALLKTYLKKLCAVPAGDSIHQYPYKCRIYAPGESTYATKKECNKSLNNPFAEITDTIQSNHYQNCPITSQPQKKYIKCNPNYYLADKCDLDNIPTFPGPSSANHCCLCPDNYLCLGDKNIPQKLDEESNQNIVYSCGKNYIGSLYQLVVRYAIQNCVRSTSITEWKLPDSVAGDVANIMSEVKQLLVKELSAECERLSGIWVDTPWTNTTTDQLLEVFYTTTQTNKLWGYCKQP